MILVRPKVETREAWQYTAGIVPEWVSACVEWTNGDAYLVRRSGKQLLNRGEWIVQNLDGDPEWLTHDQMRKTFDEVVG